MHNKGGDNMFLKPNVAEIRRKRKNLGLSKHKLSLLAGLSGTAIFRIESGSTKKVHSLRAKEIAKALNCDVYDIFEDC